MKTAEVWEAKGWIMEERRRLGGECAREQSYESLTWEERTMATMMFLWLCVLLPAGVPSAACSLPSHWTRPCVQTPPQMKPSYVHTNFSAICRFTFCLFVCLDWLCLKRMIHSVYQEVLSTSWWAKTLKTSQLLEVKMASWSNWDGRAW